MLHCYLRAYVTVYHICDYNCLYVYGYFPVYVAYLCLLLFQYEIVYLQNVIVCLCLYVKLPQECCMYMFKLHAV
jgi:hypothetical protein